MVKKRPDVINIVVVTKVTSALNQISSRGKEVDVLQIRPMKIFNTSMPINR
jgi:hypothetical protein